MLVKLVVISIVICIELLIGWLLSLLWFPLVFIVFLISLIIDIPLAEMLDEIR